MKYKSGPVVVFQLKIHFFQGCVWPNGKAVITQKLQTTILAVKTLIMGYFRSTANGGVMMAKPQELWMPVGSIAVLCCRMTSLQPYNVQRGWWEIPKAFEHGWHGEHTVKTEICPSIFGTAESDRGVLLLQLIRSLSHCRSRYERGHIPSISPLSHRTSAETGQNRDFLLTSFSWCCVVQSLPCQSAQPWTLVTVSQHNDHHTDTSVGQFFSQEVIHIEFHWNSS